MIRTSDLRSAAIVALALLDGPLAVHAQAITDIIFRHGFDCERAPLPGGTCPAECTAGCNGNRCAIDCVGTDACADATITCPPGFHCDIVCAGIDACDTATVQCAAQGECSLACDYSSCDGVLVQCGNDLCQQSCGGQPIPGNGPELDCGNACACVNACVP